MGVSTDALLVYGFVWSDEYNLLDPEGEGDDDEEREWQEVVALLRGHSNPWDHYPDRNSAATYEERDRIGKQWCVDHNDELDAWRKVRNDIEAEFGVVIECHGSDQWSVPIVCIKSASLCASRGFPLELVPGQLETHRSWDEMLANFIDTLSIDTSDATGPGWFLASWWG